MICFPRSRHEGLCYGQTVPTLPLPRPRSPCPVLPLWPVLNFWKKIDLSTGGVSDASPGVSSVSHPEMFDGFVRWMACMCVFDRSPLPQAQGNSSAIEIGLPVQDSSLWHVEKPLLKAFEHTSYKVTGDTSSPRERTFGWNQRRHANNV